MEALPPLIFFRDSDSLRDEALSSVAEFLHAVVAPDSPAGQEERALCTQLLLELAVARGSLRFNLSVLEKLDGSCPLTDRILGTLRRLGDVDAVQDPRIRSLFKQSMTRPEDSGVSQFDQIVQGAPTGGAGCGKTLLRAAVLSQLEVCARRLKSDLAAVGPHSVEATAETFTRIHALLREHPVAGCDGGDPCGSFVPLALIRLLTLNLRQCARHAARQGGRPVPNGELPAGLLGDLRGALLSFVGEATPPDEESR